MKRLIFFFALLVASLATFAQTAYNIPGVGNIYYKIVDNKAVIVAPGGGTFSSAWSGYTKPTGALTIPSSFDGYPVDSIAPHAFYDCEGLTSVTIPNSVKTIGNYTFRGCRGLRSVTIPNSVETIGYAAFSGCTGLSVYYLGDVSQWCNIQFDYPDCDISKLYFNNQLITSLVIPNSITKIPSHAFICCTGLTSVTIPNSVTSIGSSAFYGCTGLTSVTIPNSVTSIGSDAFRECSGLTSVTIGNSVDTIGNWAFYGCTGLTSVTIPNSVTTIEVGAFEGCSGLTSVTIPNSVTTIGVGSFYGYGKGAFEGCSGLTSVTIGNAVETIGSCAFKGCSGLTSVTIGNAVETIGYDAFWGCKNIAEIHAMGTTAPTLSSDAFFQISSTIPIYIPCGCSGSYYSRWSYFSNFIETGGASFSAVSENDSKGVVQILTTPSCTAPQAVLYAVANTGYRFDHWSNGSIQNPYSLTVNQDTALIAYFVLTSGGGEGEGGGDQGGEGGGTEGTGDVQNASFSIYSSANGITVTGADNQKVTVYNVQGMPVATQQRCPNTFTFAVPSTGIYFVQVGDCKAQRVVKLR